MAGCDTVLNAHADDGAGRETSGVGKQVEGLIEVGDDPGDADDVKQGLGEAQQPGNSLLAAGHTQET